MALANEAKLKGNAAWSSSDFQSALKLYTQALEYDERPEFYRNRSSTYLKLENYQAVSTKDSTFHVQ